MINKEIVKRNNYRPALFCLITFLALIFTHIPCFAEVSVEAYCQLTIYHLQLNIEQTQVLKAIVGQYPDGSEELAHQLAAKRQEHDQAKEVLCTSYGMTVDEYVFYMGKNNKVVNKYLKENPAIKQQIDSLSNELKIGVKTK